ncbi:MAG: HlyD family secretion protein [Oceanospirillaceae bacterium]|nr:HlyD family secretion protein [Oceanospirillaceae bacterium]
MSEQQPTAQAPAGARKAKIILALILVAGLAVVARMWWRGANFEETDNAYVEGYISAIAPRVDGVVTRVLFEDNQQVRAGDLLIELDPADYRVRVEEIEAQLAEVGAELKKLDADIERGEAEVRVLSAESAGYRARLKRYRLDAERQQALRNREIKAVTGTELDAAIAARDGAEADLLAHQEKIQAARAGLEATRSSRAVQQARQQVLSARLQDAELQLGYTRIEAPVDGRIGNRSVEVGDHLVKGQRLVAIIQQGVWVTANFKETQLRDLRAGQQVGIRLDTFPGEHFEGRVDSIAPAAGSKFALLPPENATGNFTKIVQRVPVKITFAPDTPKDILARVVPGMSALIEVDLRQELPETATR